MSQLFEQFFTKHNVIATCTSNLSTHKSYENGSHNDYSIPFFIYILHDCCFVHYIDVNNVLLHLNNNNNTSINNDVRQKNTYNKQLDCSRMIEKQMYGAKTIINRIPHNPLHYHVYESNKENNSAKIKY